MVNHSRIFFIFLWRSLGFYFFCERPSYLVLGILTDNFRFGVWFVLGIENWRLEKCFHEDRYMGSYYLSCIVYFIWFILWNLFDSIDHGSFTCNHRIECSSHYH